MEQTVTEVQRLQFAGQRVQDPLERAKPGLQLLQVVGMLHVLQFVSTHWLHFPIPDAVVTKVYPFPATVEHEEQVLLRLDTI